MLRHVVLLAAILALAAPALAATPQVGGTAYLVENATTGDVVLAKNSRLRVPIASITKLMTVLVALEHRAARQRRHRHRRRSRARRVVDLPQRRASS